MKTEINFTTSTPDVDRFEDTADLEGFLSANGFDGVELMPLDDGGKKLVEPQHVVGMHMTSHITWLDFWQQNEAGLVHEFGSLEAAEAYFGTLDRNAMVDHVRGNLASARTYEAAYAVFHASDCWAEESFTLKFHRTDEEVAEAVCEVLNAALDAEERDGIARADQPIILMENLWFPGLTFQRPEIARDLLQGVRGRAGFMFDTGHAFHTNWDIATQEEGIAHIHSMLDKLERTPEVLDAIRGIHLNQSISGDYVRKTLANPPTLPTDMNERGWAIFMHAFAVDTHLPFSSPDVRGLVERIAPDYLTFEFITENREQLQQYATTQNAALGRL